MTTPAPSDKAACVGRLCVGGDWACANGDLGALADVVRQLAAQAHEPLHCELASLADLCRCDPDRAIAAWMRLRVDVLEIERHPPP